MNSFIEKLTISNFLSFFGKSEVNLKPFSAIMCNYYEGKDDLLRAFEFVFGASLEELRVEKPLDLVHKVLRDEFFANRDIHTYVEITLNVAQEKKQIKFSKSIKNGTCNPRIEYKIAGLVTSRLLYEEKLNSLGICINQKNLIFYKSYFNSIIWGSAEDVEMTICMCLRESYLLEEWRRVNKEVEYIKKLKNIAAEKNYYSMNTSHSVIVKYTKKYETFFKNQVEAVEESLLNFMNDSSKESTPSLLDFTEHMSPKDTEKKKQEVIALETKTCLVTKNLLQTTKLLDLRMQEALLNSHLLHEEIKLAAKPVNASILQNRIRHIKAKVQEKENEISEIWKEIQTVKSEVENISQKISLALISLQEMQISNYCQNRFTQYGRFYDYVQPSQYLELLKQIVGVDIYYAHLCDSFEDASFLLKRLNDLKYEHREVFLPFENYSHKLKDTIIASGERGVKLNTLEELLIFLCKLKHYDLISEVPVIVLKDYNFENAAPKDYTIYIGNNIHFTSEGLLSYKTNKSDFFLGTEQELYTNLTHLYTEEEINYRKWDDLLFTKWETLVQMNSLENDVFCLKQKWKKSTQKPHVMRKLTPVPEIYEEYKNIFKEYTEEIEQSESELQGQEMPYYAESSSSASSSEESLSCIMKNLDDVIAEKKEIQTQLRDLTQELRRLNVTPIYGCSVQRNFKFQNTLNKSKLFFEREFEKLKKLMREDDFEDFLGSQEWRKTFITSLLKDFNEIKVKLKTFTQELLNISTARKRKLYQLFEHCSRYLSNTFSHILKDALPFVTINFGPGEEKIQVISCLGEEKINIVDIEHFNTLLKFISAFSIFLEIAKFEQIPVMIIDDIEEFFPIHKDNFEAVLDLNTLEQILPDKETPRFHLLMRLGQFLWHYIKKNTPGKFVRNKDNSTDYTSGPIQIIYFAKEEFVHAAEHYIWIQNQILPEEYISEDCNSYSKIQEIEFEDSTK